MAGSRQEFSSRWAQGGAKTDPLDAKTELGWIAEKPPYQFFNWWQNRVDEMLAHYEDQGIADWLTDTTYPIGGLAMGSDDLVYRAVQSQSGNDPTTDGGTNWLLLIRTSTQTNSGIIELADQGETNTGTDAVRAVTPATLEGRTATEIRRGLLELATQAEVDSLVDSNRIITPFRLGNLNASESQKGISAMANAAEVLAGTIANKAVTPAGLGALASSHAANGYQTLPGGLILQWGVTGMITNTLTFDVTLPIAYPSAHFSAMGTGPVISIGTNQGPSGAEPHPTTPLTKIRISTDNVNQIVFWTSIGK